MRPKSRTIAQSASGRRSIAGIPWPPRRPPCRTRHGILLITPPRDGLLEAPFVTLSLPRLGLRGAAQSDSCGNGGLPPAGERLAEREFRHVCLSFGLKQLRGGAEAAPPYRTRPDDTSLAVRSAQLQLRVTPPRSAPEPLMNAVTAPPTSASTCAVKGDVRGSYPPSSKAFASADSDTTRSCTKVKRVAEWRTTPALNGNLTEPLDGADQMMVSLIGGSDGQPYERRPSEPPYAASSSGHTSPVLRGFDDDLA